MNSWHYIFWHTPDAWYTHHADELEKSIRENGMQSFVRVCINDQGGWVTNGMQIPRFILSQLEQTDEDIVYLDADARVRKYPELFDTITEDIAFHTKDGVEALCGTVFIKNTPAAKELLGEWLAEQEKQYKAGHPLAAQKAMEVVCKSGKYSVFNLPPSYTQIFDSMAHHGPAVIEHMQASRQAQNHNPDGMNWKNR